MCDLFVGVDIYYEQGSWLMFRMFGFIPFRSLSHSLQTMGDRERQGEREERSMHTDRITSFI